MHRIARFQISLITATILGASAVGQQNSPPPTPSTPSAQETSPVDRESPPAPTSDTPAAAPAQGATPNAQDLPTSNQDGMFVFKKQVQEVVLHATVVDEKRQLAAHLDQTAFSVFEDGRPQTITSFHREDVPVEIGIVVDNSSSMRDKRDQVNQAVLNLIRASNPQDQVFVVNFTSNSYLDQDFTSDINLLERALNHASMRGSTALYDAVVESDIHLKQNSELEKKVLLVITDGRDNMSEKTLQEAIRQLQEGNGPILYAIGLTGPEMSSAAREALQKLADATGGSAFFPQSMDQVSEITRTLAHDIRRQYTIAYKPRNGASGTYHPIVVEARAAGYGKLTVRTRNGYYTGESVR